MSTFSELIDFTRSSTGTYLDSVVYGDELVTNGTFDTDSDWAKGTGWAISGGTASKTAGTGSSLVSTTLNGTIGKSYLLTFDLTLSAGVINSTLGAAVTPVYNSSGSYAEILKPTTTGAFQFYGSSSFVGSIDNVSVKEIIGGQGTAGTPLLRTADANVPRLEYDASGQPLGLLIEEQRTNLLYHSEAFDNGYWSKENTNVTSDQIVAPDGTNSADKIIEANTTNTFHFVTKSMSTSAGVKTFSAYFKKAERGFAALTLRVDGGAKRLAVIFDLTNGTVADTLTYGSPTQTNSTIENAGNGWYRCSVTAYHSATGNIIALLSPQDDGNGGGNINMDYAGTVGYGVYAWGAQLESGAFPTSYIPTSGSTVTRNSDFAPIPVERFAFDASEGTLFVHAVTAAGLNTSTGQCAVSMSSGATANCYRLRKNVSTEEIGMLKRVADSNVININGKIVGETSTFKACGNYSATDLNLSIDGEDVITGSASSSTITISKVDVGTSPFGDADCFNGHIKRIQYFPKRLSNDKLVELTKPSSSPTMSLTFDGQATSELVEGLHD
jgi:hypothetical protein